MPNEFEQEGEKIIKQSRDHQANDEKLCPFSFSASTPIACTPRCKLYRNEPKGYECMLQELRSIAWNTNKRSQSQR